MPFRLLTASDDVELAATWRERSKEFFEKSVVNGFVDEMTDLEIQRDLKQQLLNRMQTTARPEQLWVYAGRSYDPDYRFTLPSISPTKWLSIKQLIYRTDALDRLESQLGKNIKVKPLYENGLIYFKIEYWLPRQIMNPEDE